MQGGKGYPRHMSVELVRVEVPALPPGRRAAALFSLTVPKNPAPVTKGIRLALTFSGRDPSESVPS